VYLCYSRLVNVAHDELYVKDQPVNIAKVSKLSTARSTSHTRPPFVCKLYFNFLYFNFF